jgi:hypothetical protein
MTRAIQRIRAVIGVAGLVLATPISAQQTTASDSLGLQVLNDHLHLLPGPLSLDISRGQFRAFAPHLQKIGLGVEHAIWGIPRRRTGLATEFVFASDSRSPFARSISDQSPMVMVAAIHGSDDVDSVLVFEQAIAAVRSVLGPPEFCDRDTVLHDAANTFTLRTQAGWVRSGARVLYSATFDVRDEPHRLREYFPRFVQMWQVFRDSDKLIRRPLPQRHDTPCFFTDEEIRSYRVPLDTSAYRAARATLLGRPE